MQASDKVQFNRAAHAFEFRIFRSFGPEGVLCQRFDAFIKMIKKDQQRVGPCPGRVGLAFAVDNGNFAEKPIFSDTFRGLRPVRACIFLPASFLELASLVS